MRPLVARRRPRSARCRCYDHGAMVDEASESSDDKAASTGVAGLDEILKGGFPCGEMNLVQGGAGTGKTTLALQFLFAGAAAGEKGLYITLAQTKRGLYRIARSHGWTLDSMIVHELSPGG